MLGGHRDPPIFTPLFDLRNASNFFHNASKHECLRNEPAILNL
jgi:hypothetical protein